MLIFDLGTAGDGSSNFTFLFDDIRLTNQIPTSLLALPVTFDITGSNYAVTDFGNNQTVDAVDPSMLPIMLKKQPNQTEQKHGRELPLVPALLLQFHLLLQLPK